MSSTPPGSLGERLRALAQQAADVVDRFKIKRPDMDCPACGAAMVHRQVTEFRCHGCQATWIVMKGRPLPTMQERRRVQAIGAAPWWTPLPPLSTHTTGGTRDDSDRDPETG